MFRSEWMAEFRRAWNARTWHYPNELRSLESCGPVTPGYIGVDFSISNYWQEDSEPDVFWFGDPYRKEVSADDNLGTYQRQWFRMMDGVIVGYEDAYNTGCFVSPRISMIGCTPAQPLWKQNEDGIIEYDAQAATYLYNGLDVYRLGYKTVADSVAHFYHETGVHY